MVSTGSSKILPYLQIQTQMYKEGAVCFREIIKPSNLVNLGSELPEVMMVCDSRIMELTSADEQTIITKDPIV